MTRTKPLEFSPLPPCCPIPNALDPKRRIAQLEPLLTDDHWTFQKPNILKLIEMYESGELGPLTTGTTIWLHDGEVLDREPGIQDLPKGSAIWCERLAQQMTQHSHLTGPIHVDKTERFVASLIMSQTLDATLLHSEDSASSTMLRFSTAVPRFHYPEETSIQAQLDEEKRALGILIDCIEQSDHSLELNNEYIDSLERAQRRISSSQKGSLSMAVDAADALDFDEDMMGDLHG